MLNYPLNRCQRLNCELSHTTTEDWFSIIISFFQFGENQICFFNLSFIFVLELEIYYANCNLNIHHHPTPF